MDKTSNQGTPLGWDDPLPDTLLSHILPKNHHLSKLVVLHYHGQIHHQGRQITHGAIRQAGYWLVGGHRLVTSVLQSCVNCKKLRGTTLEQTLADLPRDRIEPAAPFTNVGFDAFGPLTIVTRKTRGGAANSKRWGLVFICLSSRAIHIEVLESMDASSFICALRRFFASRSRVPVKMRPRNQFHWRKIRARRCPPRNGSQKHREVRAQARLRMGVQSSTRFALWLSMGAPNSHNPISAECHVRRTRN